MSKPNQHLVWPVRIADDGQLATVTQGSRDDLVSQVGLIAVTRPGERPLVPDFGVASPIGGKRVKAEVLQSACDRWIGPGLVNIQVLHRGGGLVEQLVEVSS